MSWKRWSHVHLGKIPANSSVGKYSSGQIGKVKGIGFLQQEPGALLGKLEPDRAKYSLPAHLRAWGHRDHSRKVKHHLLWIREGATHNNMKHLESVSISLHTTFKDKRWCLLAATRALTKSFSLPKPLHQHCFINNNSEFLLRSSRNNYVW